MIGLALSMTNLVTCIAGGIVSIILKDEFKFSVCLTNDPKDDLVMFFPILVAFTAALSAFFSSVRFFVAIADEEWFVQTQVVVFDEYLHLLQVCSIDLHGATTSNLLENQESKEDSLFPEGATHWPWLSVMGPREFNSSYPSTMSTLTLEPSFEEELPAYSSSPLSSLESRSLASSLVDVRLPC